MYRKTVTVLFCDVVGSTAMGESSDPERLRAVLARYFDRMKAIVEGHGGSVEKFIGDAVMAVFGVPAAHEDDALRAVRAAVDMRAAFPELGIQGRIGVNTGEVITGTEERLATGDAVNVAARLQAAAAPDEVLIGSATLDLVRGAVVVEPLEPLALKGKTDPIAACRLVSVTSAPERSHLGPFVGRERELEVIRSAWDGVRSEARCQIVTILGDAGVGKSRLVAEALAGIDARIIRARCLPYGEGITYWPVTEAIKALGATPNDPAVTAAIGPLLGESDRQTSADEIAWAFRKLLEQVAPVVVVFDDIHWGEQVFLDLVEGVGLFSSGAPILLLCLARPELLDRRGTWPSTLRLDPLADDEVRELIGEQVSVDLGARIARASGGNPLFLTEMLAMATQTDAVDVPPTLRALLAARLDQLAEPERRVLERGSIEGEVFHRGAVQALSPDEQVTPRLAALVRKQLIQADKAQIPGDDGFRFRHLLIRDAAYDALPKSARAELHERFADWLDTRAADIVELDDIVGYHLEQAARYRSDLDEPHADLALRAAERLRAAALRARWLSDEPATALLLERSLTLSRPHRLDVYRELDLADAYWKADSRRASLLADSAADRAHHAGDLVGAAVARTVAARHRRKTGESTVDDLESAARAALALAESAGDHTGLVHVWRGLGTVASHLGQYEASRHAAAQAREHARAAGWPFLISRSANLPGSLMHGPVPADEALRILVDALPEHPEPRSTLFQAVLHAMLGEFDVAAELAERASFRLKERTDDSPAWAWAVIANFRGDHGKAALHLRQYVDHLSAHNIRSNLSTTAPQLARELWAIGRPDEAEPFARLGRTLGDARDIMTQMVWRQAQALVHSSRGEHEEAMRLAQEAVAIGEPTDMTNNRGDALIDLAEVQWAAGHPAAARAALDAAAALYEGKRNLAMLTQVKTRLAEMGVSSSVAPAAG